jgi:hypothetical protein
MVPVSVLIFSVSQFTGIVGGAGRSSLLAVRPVIEVSGRD